MGETVTWTEIEGLSKRKIYYSIVLLKKVHGKTDVNNFDKNFVAFVAENKEKIDEVKMFSEGVKKLAKIFNLLNNSHERQT